MTFRSTLALSLTSFVTVIGGTGTIWKLSLRSSLDHGPVQETSVSAQSPLAQVRSQGLFTSGTPQTPVPSSGTVAMTDGVASPAVYGHTFLLKFSEIDRGKIFAASSLSQQPIRLELWNGEIEKNDRMWWGNGRQEVARYSEGIQLDSLSPRFAWTIQPGTYTLLICRVSREQTPLTVSYAISESTEAKPIESSLEAVTASPPSVKSNQATPQQIENVSSHAGDRQIRQMSMFELDCLRNEPYAKRGYIFKRKDLKSYFSKQSWYKPSRADEQQIWEELNTNEQLLIKKVKDEQQRRNGK